MKYQQLALQTARLSDDKSEYKRVKLKLKLILSFKIVLIILCFVFAILAVIHGIFTKTDRERTYKQLLPYLEEGEYCYVDLYPEDEISNYKAEISESFNVGSSNKGIGINHIRNYHLFYFHGTENTFFIVTGEEMDDEDFNRDLYSHTGEAVRFYGKKAPMPDEFEKQRRLRIFNSQEQEQFVDLMEKNMFMTIQSSVPQTYKVITGLNSFGILLIVGVVMLLLLLADYLLNDKTVWYPKAVAKLLTKGE